MSRDGLAGERTPFVRIAGILAVGVAVAAGVVGSAPAAAKTPRTIILQSGKGGKFDARLVDFINEFFNAFANLGAQDAAAGDAEASASAIPSGLSAAPPFLDVRPVLLHNKVPSVLPLTRRLRLVVLRPELSHFVPLGRFPIHTGDIADGAVTAPKLAANSVTSTSVAPNSLTLADIGDISQFSTAIDIPSVTAQDCDTEQYTATPARAGQVPEIAFDGGLPAGLIAEAIKVPTDGAVIVRFCNSRTSASTAATGLGVKFVFTGS